MLQSDAKWMRVCAGGRRKVLRQLVPAISRFFPRPMLPAEDFFIAWQGDQPALWIRLAPDHGSDAVDRIVARTEETLDALMARHPWDDQPLLEWPGAAGVRQLSVQVGPGTTAVDAAAIPESGAASTALAEEIHSLLIADGTLLKDAWVEAMRLALGAYPELGADSGELIRQIHQVIRPRVMQHLEQMRARGAIATDMPALWPVLDRQLRVLDPPGQAQLLHAVANRLALRPDEEAYVMLVAHTLSAAPGGTGAERQ